MLFRFPLPLIAVLLATAASAVAPDAVPASVVGEWRKTTINGRSYWDGRSGQYVGHGGGFSETFVFEKDGTYKDFVYIENSPMAGWTTQIFTTTEGVAEWSGDTVRLVPKKGNYKVRDNRVKRQNYERPMTDEERKKMIKSYRYSIETEDGKPVLVVKQEKSEVRLKRAE